jgi:hypothetical protein
MAEVCPCPANGQRSLQRRALGEDVEINRAVVVTGNAPECYSGVPCARNTKSITE